MPDFRFFQKPTFPEAFAMSALGLGCVKTRRRASAVEKTFVQIAVRCAKIRK
jgi:hypothetical protein